MNVIQRPTEQGSPIAAFFAKAPKYKWSSKAKASRWESAYPIRRAKFHFQNEGRFSFSISSYSPEEQIEKQSIEKHHDLKALDDPRDHLAQAYSESLHTNFAYHDL